MVIQNAPPHTHTLSMETPGLCLVDPSLSLRVSLIYCQVGRAVAGLQIGRAVVFISLPLDVGREEGK